MSIIIPCRYCGAPCVPRITTSLAALAEFVVLGILCERCYQRQEEERSHDAE